MYLAGGLLTTLDHHKIQTRPGSGWFRSTESSFDGKEIQVEWYPMEAVLDKNWSWKQRDPSVDVLGEIGSDGWKPATSFPSEIHVELIKAGLIPGPFVGFNEHKVQCALRISLNGSSLTTLRDWTCRMAVQEHLPIQFEEQVCHIGVLGTGHRLRRLPGENYVRSWPLSLINSRTTPKFSNATTSFRPTMFS